MVTDVMPYNSHSKGPWLTRPVGLLVAARAVNQLGAFSVPFLAVLLVQRYGAPLSTAGAVVSLFGAATIPSRLLGGWLTRRSGARSTMVLGLTLCALAQVGIAAAPGLPAAAAAAIGLGLAFEIYEPACQSLIAELTEPEHRPRAFSLFGAALALGGVVGGALGTEIGGVDLRLLFVADAASCLVCAGAVRLLLPDRRAAPHEPETQAVRPWRDPRLLAMLGVGTGFGLLYLQLRIALPLTLVARGVPGARFGIVMAASSLVVVLAQPLLGWTPVARRLHDPFTAMALGFVVLAGGLAVTARVTTLAGFVLATAVWALGDVLLLGHPFAAVAALAPPGGSAAYLAAYGTCWGIAGVVAPMLGAATLGLVGPTGLWLGCAAIALVLAAGQPAVRRLVAEPQALSASL